MKIGEGTTDENGEVTVEVPNNLPGDDKGNITLLAKLDENETFGNMAASAVQKWGLPICKNRGTTQGFMECSSPDMDAGYIYCIDGCCMGPLYCNCL
ncbi:MAG: hypothetical protein IPJ60_19345 [Sphingobacteriaceae bacterium]|nr:hypothetical protein [Sphingobacteriaceae bacterium]